VPGGTGAAAIGNEAAVSGIGKAVPNKLESSGTEHSDSGRSHLAGEPGFVGRTGPQTADWEAPKRTAAGDFGWLIGNTPAGE